MWTQLVGMATNSSGFNLWFNWVLLHILQQDNFKRYQAFSHSSLLSCRSNRLIFCIISEIVWINYFECQNQSCTTTTATTATETASTATIPTAQAHSSMITFLWLFYYAEITVAFSGFLLRALPWHYHYSMSVFVRLQQLILTINLNSDIMNPSQPLH